jgi:hypothetical protein
MANTHTTRFKCARCNRMREGSPVETDLHKPPICWHCESYLKTWLQKNPTSDSQDLTYVRPSRFDPEPPELTRYIKRWKKQNGRCTGCRRKFDQMYAIYTHMGKIRGLRCVDCYIKVVENQHKPREFKTVPIWWASMPFWMREFAFQNPSVRIDLAKAIDNPAKAV